MKEEQTKPFLRWAGGKKWLIKYLDDIIGNDFNFNNYFEPFLGGASMFLAFSPKNHAYLSDLNKELIDTYESLKEDPISIINIMKSYVNEEEFYYKIRKMKTHTKSEAAAKFIFMNQTSFNGLYRVNNKGEYNVPYGHRTKNFLEEDNLKNMSKRLKNATLLNCDFEQILELVCKDDLVFLDPPYTVSHNNNGFIKYNQKLFSLEDQYRLSQFIDQIKNKGAYYILTNAAHVEIDKIFEKGDRKIELSRSSLIGGINADRKKVSEYIFTNIKRGG